MAPFLLQSTRKSEPAAAVPLLPCSSLQWLPSPCLRSPPPLHYMTLSSKLRLFLCIIVMMRLLLSLLLYSIGDLRCLKLLLTFKKIFCSATQVLNGPTQFYFPHKPNYFCGMKFYNALTVRSVCVTLYEKQLSFHWTLILAFLQERTLCFSLHIKTPHSEHLLICIPFLSSVILLAKFLYQSKVFS